MNKNKLPKRLQGLKRYSWSLLVTFLIAGWFFPAIGLIALICMVAPVVTAFFTENRKWCATSCPRGVFNDVILKKISRNKKIPKFFHSTVFKIGFFVFLMFNFITGLMAAQSIADVGLVFLKMVSLTSGITIVLGIFFHPRTWCAFCPMGFSANIVAILKRAWKLNDPETSFDTNI